jgi:hypothetical protein
MAGSPVDHVDGSLHGFGAQSVQGFLEGLRCRYEIARQDPAWRRLCQASLHLASFSRTKTNQISGSDFRVVRRRFSVGMSCLLQLRTISASHDYCAIICCGSRRQIGHSVAEAIAHYRQRPTGLRLGLIEA